jgi:hypothetical protein
MNFVKSFIFVRKNICFRKCVENDLSRLNFSDFSPILTSATNIQTSILLKINTLSIFFLNAIFKSYSIYIKIIQTQLRRFLSAPQRKLLLKGSLHNLNCVSLTL